VNRLSIENSTSEGSLAAECTGHDLLSFQFHGSAELGTVLRDALAAMGQLSQVVVGIGPGSYTGIRVAIATAIGLEWSLGCKTFGYPSVLGYAEKSYAVIGDARRDSCAVTVVRNRALVDGPRLINREAVAAFLETNQQLPLFAVNKIPGWPDLEIRVPEAKYLLDKTEVFVPLTEPLYLKGPHITTPRKGAEGFA
jgi:tRNA A37 threonylcarbamoyladenosine modification protein TsaB